MSKALLFGHIAPVHSAVMIENMAADSGWYFCTNCLHSVIAA